MSTPQPEDRRGGSSYKGVERRAAPAATRKFVVIFFILTTIMVTGVFAYAQHRFGGVNEDSRETTYLNQLDSCVRGFDIRNEFATRIPQHITDAQNLLNLAISLQEISTAQARAFAAIDRRLPGAIPELSDLIKNYRLVRDKTKAIAQSQKKISFQVLQTVNCIKSVKRPPDTRIDVPDQTKKRIMEQKPPVIPSTTLTSPATPTNDK